MKCEIFRRGTREGEALAGAKLFGGAAVVAAAALLTIIISEKT